MVKSYPSAAPSITFLFAFYIIHSEAAFAHNCIEPAGTGHVFNGSCYEPGAADGSNSEAVFISDRTVDEIRLQRQPVYKNRNAESISLDAIDAYVSDPNVDYAAIIIKDSIREPINIDCDFYSVKDGDIFESQGSFISVPALRNTGKSCADVKLTLAHFVIEVAKKRRTAAVVERFQRGAIEADKELKWVADVTAAIEGSKEWSSAIQSAAASGYRAEWLNTGSISEGIDGGIKAGELAVYVDSQRPQPTAVLVAPNEDDLPTSSLGNYREGDYILFVPEVATSEPGFYEMADLIGKPEFTTVFDDRINSATGDNLKVTYFDKSDPSALFLERYSADLIRLGVIDPPLERQ